VLALSALVLAAAGCDKIPLVNKIPFLSKKPAAQPAVTTAPAPAPAAADTTRPAPAPPPPAETPRAVAQLIDEPWTPVDTGTVTPGMTRDQVIAVWGIPVAERTIEGRTFLYFRNGCEVSCGTFDVVFLENNQVVDAIVRGVGHTYAGVSSSPPERQGVMTPPQRPPGPPDTVSGRP
jgi:hypothetical protein